MHTINAEQAIQAVKNYGKMRIGPHTENTAEIADMICDIVHMLQHMAVIGAYTSPLERADACPDIPIGERDRYE